MKSSTGKYIAAFLIIACIAAGIIYAVTRKPDRPSPVPPPPIPSPEPTVKVKIYYIAVSENQPRLQPVEVEVEAKKDPIESAIRYLIEQGECEGMANPIPDGTKLLGLQMSNGLAMLDLSKEFRDNFRGGSEAEALTISAILRTLGQFSDVKRVQLLIEGKPLETLGHLDLSGPLSIDSADSAFGVEGGM